MPSRRKRTRFDAAKLAPLLDGLMASYDRRYLSTDPLQFLHRYEDPADREAVGLLASCLAYGQVGQVLASVEAVLERMGPRPSRYVRELSVARAVRDFRGFKHRWTDGRDVAALLEAIRRAWDEHGTLGDFFASGFREEDATVEAALRGFSAGMLSRLDRRLYADGRIPPSTAFLFPSPPASACKRLNLYLRWMVRSGDGLDFGQWSRIPRSALIIPLDTHVARIGAYIGLTSRRTVGWAMASEITESLRRLDPADPVKYDFAICRLGILDHCPRKRDPERCRECMLLTVCRL